MQSMLCKHVWIDQKDKTNERNLIFTAASNKSKLHLQKYAVHTYCCFFLCYVTRLQSYPKIYMRPWTAARIQWPLLKSQMGTWLVLIFLCHSAWQSHSSTRHNLVTAAMRCFPATQGLRAIQHAFNAMSNLEQRKIQYNSC